MRKINKSIFIKAMLCGLIGVFSVCHPERYTPLIPVIFFALFILGITFSVRYKAN